MRGSLPRMTIALALISIVGCVGSEPESDAPVARSDRSPDGDTESAKVAAYPDTVQPAAYRVFQEIVERDEPRKLTLRLLVYSDAPDAISKTLRVALDSLATVDSSVVAAQAVAYAAGRSGAGREVPLVPVAWALWVPPEGWDGATAESRQRMHRTYIYHDAPSASGSASGPGEGSNGTG